MPSEGPRRIFDGVSPTAPPVGLSAGWTSVQDILERNQLDDLHCVPSYVLIFNVKITELAQVHRRPLPPTAANCRPPPSTAAHHRPLFRAAAASAIWQ